MSAERGTGGGAVQRGAAAAPGEGNPPPCDWCEQPVGGEERHHVTLDDHGGEMGVRYFCCGECVLASLLSDAVPDVERYGAVQDLVAGGEVHPRR